MKVRILSAADVKQLLPMQECINVMAETLKTMAQGDGINPLRTLLRFPDESGLLGMMPAYLESPKSTGIKVVTVMPGNHGTPYDSHQGVVMVFETGHGCPVAMVDASSITAIRTAAVSGVATDLLARKDAGVLALLGSGVQAESHLKAMLCVRDFREVRIWSRSFANAQRFVSKAQEQHNIVFECHSHAKQAVAGAAVICTVTSAREPILAGSWLMPGAHINAVGSCFPAARELDSDAVVKARLYVDLRESTLNESGDFLIPKSEGKIDENHIIGEIRQLLLGDVGGRVSDSEITLFKSLGIAVEDLAAAHYVYDKAEKKGAGTTVAL